MPTGPSYKIVTNSRKRRILVVNRMVNPGQIDELENEDFDAIFLNVANRTYEETRLVSRWLSPTREGKSFLKPRFGNVDMQNFMRQVVDFFDGLCDNPLDETFANRIEEIYQNIEKYGINRDIGSDISTTSRLLANLVKYDITRGRLTFTNHAIRGLAQGFSNRYLMMYDNHETLQLDERMKFVQKLEELGYAERTRLVDRIHICKECGDSHQLFIECCPKCKSSDIQQESMIHHFRCANISPESTYFKDGALVCPKCRRTLRHIGVDYDRPATVFSCFCGNTFMQSAMKVMCTNCSHISTPEELIPTDVYEYKLTPAGIAAFASDEAIFQLESTDIYSGRSTFENFCESIRVFHTLPSYENQTILVFRYHYVYNGTQEDAQVFDVMRNIMMHNATVKLTTNDNNFYVLLVAPSGKIDAEYKFAKTNLDRIFNELSEENEEFDARWLKTYRFNRDQDPDEFVKEITEKIEDSMLEDLHEISDNNPAD
ncbi:MAG: hypothetical protein J1E95_00820 [Muribaculaceae bacterium]|nr:hypothetical protein [Muribaculaceae bacterium]